jgi:diguanylate cyclase (GGDEF)-like protein
VNRSSSSAILLLSCALVAVVPAAVAAYFTPNLWTIFACAGAAIGTTVILARGHGADQTLAAVDVREKKLQASVSALESKVTALETQLRESSAHDDVTGTLNRRTFLVRLDEAIRRDMRLKKPMAFLLVDIEGFRKFNADSGRMAGDGVLRTVGRALKASTRGTDFVGRIGGDEFAVVLGECLDPRPAVDRIQVALHGEAIVSMGLVTVDSARADVDPMMLFRLAEEALASVKGGASSRCGKRAYPVEEIPPVTALR